MEKIDSDRKAAWYAATDKSLISFIAKGYSRLKFERRRTTLNPCMEMVDITMNWDTYENEKLYLPVTSGWYLIAGRDCLD